MKISKILLVLLGLSGIAWAEQPTLRLSDFSGGLNTKDGIFQVKPNQATICTNFDLGVTPGALTKRKGYEDVGYFDPAGTYATTGLVSMYAHYYRDGRKELFGIGYAPRSAGAGQAAINWGRLYRSGNQRLILDTAIFNYCYTGARWHWVSWKNNVILSNGRQRPIIWNGKTARTLTLPAPGEPQIVPMDTVGHLKGEYRYLLRYAAGTLADDTANARLKSTYVSAPVYADNEKILLYNFPSPTIDSVRFPDDTLTDTIKIIILRTKGNTGDVNDSTIFYRLGDVSVPTIVIHKSAIDTFTYIDTTSDVNLSTIGSVGAPTIDGMTNAGVLAWPKFGMPSFIDRVIDSADAAPAIPTKRKVNPDTTLWGDSVLYICYFVTYFDSVNQVESDSGRVFAIQPKAADDTTFYRMGIPPAPGGDPGLFRILYKGLMYRNVTRADTTLDTTDRARNLIKIQRDLTRNILNTGDMEQIKNIALLRRFLSDAVKREIKNKINVINDTIMATNYFPLAIIRNPDSVAYTDSLVWDTLSARQPYFKATAPAHLNHVTYFRDQLWGSVGSRVYHSYLDSIGYWGMFDNVAFDLDDGDEITAIVPDREFVNVFKNKKQYVLYEDSDGGLTKKWTEAGRGCVAPFSIAWYDGNLIYLDETGVYSQTGSIYKDKGSTRQALSDPIANQIDFPIRDLKNAVGFVHRDQYWLSFPEKDSTFVFDFKTGGWSAYTYAFDAAVHYDTVSNNGLVPSNDMLFCRKAHTLYVTADSLIYKADTTYGDNGSTITGQWQSQPLLLSNEYVSLDGIGFWRGADADTGRVIVTVYNSAGASAATDTLNMYNATFPRYGILGINTTNQNNYLQIRLRTSGIDSLVLHGLDIYGKINGAVEIR